MHQWSGFGLKVLTNICDVYKYTFIYISMSCLAAVCLAGYSGPGSYSRSRNGWFLVSKSLILPLTSLDDWEKSLDNFPPLKRKGAYFIMLDDWIVCNQSRYRLKVNIVRKIITLLKYFAEVKIKIGDL